MNRQIPAEYYYRNFLHPKYWLTWIGIFSLYLISWLPLSAKMKLATFLGMLMYKQGGARLRVTRTNINACFPELNGEDRENLIKETFIANMKGLVETTIAWWCDHKPVLANVDIYGLEHLKEAEARNKGVLMVGGHFSILDLAGPMVNSVLDFSYMYRPNNNPLFDACIERHRMRYRHQKFTKFQRKEMIEFIKQGNTVWYGYDQDFGRKRSVFAPFFNIQTATLKSPLTIAKETQATVIMVAQFREPNNKYSIHFSPIFENILEEDEVTTATRLNKQLEDFVKLHPEQYLWMHRRFSTRPEGEERFYPKKQKKKKKQAIPE